MQYDILIVGAGHGGAQAAIALRQAGFAGTIGMVGDEPYIPYERPPLSKEYFAGEKPFERLLIRQPGFWQERNVDVVLDKRIVKVDPQARLVSTAQGSSIGYGRLIWAAGGTPKRLACPGADLAGIHVVRTRDDVDAIKASLESTQRVVVIGGGYIGLEAAAGLVKQGKTVTLLEALPRVLARVAGEAISEFYTAEHRAHGVQVYLEARMSAIEGESGRVTGVRLANGEIIPADMVIVGIGITPAVEPLIAAGATGSNGVDVDGFCRTSLPDIYAIGDCAAHENPFAGGQRVRVESVQNANDQATLVAKFILEQTDQPYHAVPWFWSNQYDLRLQTVGISAGADEQIVRGDPATRSFTVVYLKGGRVVALDCVNAAKDFVQGRKLVAESVKVEDRTRIEDASLALKDLLA